MLNTIGRTRNVELSTLRVYNVLAGFVHSVSVLDTVLTTRIELLGQVSESNTLQELFLWSTKVLGLIAERVRENAEFKTQSNKPTNKPSAHAADGHPKKGSEKPNQANPATRQQLTQLMAHPSLIRAR
eukprot:6308266-Amphidinium_carterae.1